MVGGQIGTVGGQIGTVDGRIGTVGGQILGGFGYSFFAASAAFFS